MPEPQNGARPGGGTGAGQETGREALESDHHGTAPVMIDGATNVAMIPAAVGEARGRIYSPLAVQLLDTERAADRLLEELGAAHCRRLALALLELVQEVAR